MILCYEIKKEYSPKSKTIIFLSKPPLFNTFVKIDDQTNWNPQQHKNIGKPDNRTCKVFPIENNYVYF